jgi:hypothetical protein
MDLERWMSKVEGMIDADLKTVRNDYRAHEKQVMARVMGGTQRHPDNLALLFTCRGVASWAQGAIKALDGAGKKVVTLAQLEEAQPAIGWVGPIAYGLSEWERLGGLPTG